MYLSSNHQYKTTYSQNTKPMKMKEKENKIYYKIKVFTIEYRQIHLPYTCTMNEKKCIEISVIRDIIITSLPGHVLYQDPEFSV